MTTNTKIDRELKGVDRYKGIYLYDQLRSLPPLVDGVIVINYVTTQEVMENIIGHYVVFDNRQNLIKGNGTKGAFFFDPYGFPPDKPARELLGLPNTYNITKFIDRSLEASNQFGYISNTEDFQVKKPWDELCGLYAVLYTTQPDFSKNAVFSIGTAPGVRVKLDQNLERLYKSIGFLGI